MQDKRETYQYTVRFHRYNPEHRKAWTHLRSIDKTEYKSYTDFIAKVINAYFEKDSENTETDTGKRENRLIDRICEAVQKCIADALSSEILKQVFNSDKKTETAIKNESSVSDIDWDFLCGKDDDVNI